MQKKLNRGWHDRSEVSRTKHSSYDPVTDKIFTVTSAVKDSFKNRSRVLNNNKNSKINKLSYLRRFQRNMETYLRYCTLHGLRYMGDKTISYGERLFWLLAFLFAVSCAAYFIDNIYEKYNTNPVLVAMNPNPTPVQEIPFPAVTICNMNAAKKTISEAIIANGTAADKSFLNDICEIDDATITSKDVDHDTGKWDNVFKFISKISQSCEDMLKVCKWRSKNVACDEIFKPVLTDEGLCCNFNQLPLPYILRDPGNKTSFNESFPKYPTDDWNPERGYLSNTSYDTYPFRSPGPGANLGLTVVLDADVNDYFCSSGSSAGFKILLHNPVEIPKMTDFASILPPGYETRVVFKPIITDATPGLKTIDVQKRGCYFADERYLKYYRTYTKVNCKMECLANATLQRCGCVPYYLPKINSTKICGKMQEDCCNSVREMMELKQMAQTEEKECDCLPACFQLEYEKTTSYGLFTNTFKLKQNIIRNESAEYFKSNMAVVHIYFVNSQFNRFTKSELYGFPEFVSNTGGILGLFLGFSILSVIEIFYHLTLRVLCNFVRSNKRNRRSYKMRLVK